MIWRASELNGYSIKATDGTIGSVDDLLFDDQSWTVRWLVVDTGNWLPGRRVLLPPSSLGEPQAQQLELSVSLTRKQVEASPGFHTDAPVSRQKEAAIYGYYGWAPYWGAGLGYPLGGYPGFPPGGDPGAGHPGYAALGSGAVPPPVAAEVRQREQHEKAHQDPHLRSSSYVTGFVIAASDGELGHVDDFLVDGERWAIRYMIVDTVNWWPGKKVLVAPQWIGDISWSKRSVAVGLSRDKIKASPEYQPTAPLEQGYEVRLHQHYGFQPYWE